VKIVVTTIVDRIWPIHRVEIKNDDDVVIATGEARNYPGSMDATVQQAAEAAISMMEQQLKIAREHMRLNGLLR
jgi:hypothetical protein